MAYVTVPKDLTHVKSKVLFGLTKRQLVCFGGALLTGGPLYFLTRDYLSNSAAALLMIFAMLPGLLFALFERHGQPLEVVIQQMIQCCFIRPKERPYQTNNAYAALVRQYQMEQEVKAIVQKNDTPRNRKAQEAHPRPEMCIRDRLLTLRIERLSSDGSGVAHSPEGEAVFVPGRCV